jgi:hypothetical protein
MHLAASIYVYQAVGIHIRQQVYLSGNKHMYLAGAYFRQQAEVGNVSSKRNGITCYRLSHVFRAITTKTENVSYGPRAITLRRGNDFILYVSLEQ